MSKQFHRILSLAILVTFAVALSGVIQTAQATVVRLPEGLEITVGVADGEEATGNKLEKGDSVDIVLLDPIVIDDSTIVEQGAPGRAVVVEAEGNGMFGKAGMLKIEFAYLMPKGAFTTDDNQPIMISGEAEKIGKGKKTISYALTIVIVGAFIKGGEGEIESLEPHPAKIAESIKLRSN